MTPRSIRLAVERKAMKVARKAALREANPTPSYDQIVTARSGESVKINSACFNIEGDLETSVSSPARIAANRANSLLSTGPRSEEGKEKVSLNAVKTGLTGHTVLLPNDDSEAYRCHIAPMKASSNPWPGGNRSRSSIADTVWRILRVPGLELAIYAKGSLVFAGAFNDRPADERPALIEAETYLMYGKEFKNLHIQEARLLLRREKETAELCRLRQERTMEEKKALSAAAKLYTAAKAEGKSFEPGSHGFEFSMQAIEAHIELTRGAQKAQSTSALSSTFGV